MSQSSGWGFLVVLLAVGALLALVTHSSVASGSRSRALASDQSPLFPLRVASGGRYLVDAKGRPFFLNGDAAWSLIVQLTNEETERYLEDRRRKGFNTILVNLLEHWYASDAPRNAYGDAPFKQSETFVSPNERYFAHVDSVIRMARDKGILVLLAPSYLGWDGGDDGWWSDMKAAGDEKLRAYGRYLGQRYRKFSNIIWVNGGDYSPPQRDGHLVSAIAEGIREEDAKLQTFHGAPYASSIDYWGKGQPWLAVNSVYTGYWDVVAVTRSAYRQSTMPAYLIEAKYENEGVSGDGSRPATPHVLRVQAYQSILSGAFGSVMGNNPIWLFDKGWQGALDSPGTRSIAQLGKFFRSLRWWLLRPDARGVLLTDGIRSDADQAVAARSANGDLAVVYSPSARTMAIDLTKLRGPLVRAQWFDPVSGKLRAVSGSPLRTSERHDFTTPAKNAGGDGDFVLLLTSTRT
jgi:hypothetical protein